MRQVDRFDCKTNVSHLEDGWKCSPMHRYEWDKQMFNRLQLNHNVSFHTYVSKYVHYIFSMVIHHSIICKNYRNSRIMFIHTKNHWVKSYNLVFKLAYHGMNWVSFEYHMDIFCVRNSPFGCAKHWGKRWTKNKVNPTLYLCYIESNSLKLCA